MSADKAIEMIATMWSLLADAELTEDEMRALMDDSSDEEDVIYNGLNIDDDDEDDGVDQLTDRISTISV